MKKTSEKKLWDSFAGFRKLIGSVLRQIKEVPIPLIDEVEYIDYEGGGVVCEMFSAYECAEDALKLMNKRGFEYLSAEDCWNDAVAQCHDMMIEIISEYRNPWNYAPGPTPPKLDEASIAKQVEQLLYKKVDELFASSKE